MNKKIKTLGISFAVFALFGCINVHEKPATHAVYALQDVKMAENIAEDLKINAKAAYLMEYSTQTPIYTKAECERLPIASMCKIMTLLLSLEAIDAGVMDMREEITVSEKAASMGGSQVFLEANAKYSVHELIKSIVVCSANDSCVAMAERVCGSESVFVDKMNRRAAELGMSNTLFANCTGLPKQPQYSCAKDVAIMLKELLKHDEYYEFGKVWMDKFQHPQGRYTEISNTNKLVRFYDGCDGGKTGFTNEAGFCLAATAKRKDLRVISVVIGAESSDIRFGGVREMFDYTFANYENAIVYKAGEALEENGYVSNGKQKSLPFAPAEDITAFRKRGAKSDVLCKIELGKLKAPIQKGDCVGEMVVYVKNVENRRVPLIALENVDKAKLWDKIKEVALSWNG